MAPATPPASTRDVTSSSSPLAKPAWHLLSLTLPAITLAFTTTGPHPWWLGLGFIGIVPMFGCIDLVSPKYLSAPPENPPGKALDWMLYSMVVLQVVNVGSLIWLAMRVPLNTADGLGTLIGAAVVVGANSGGSAIVVAHELVHRPKAHQFLLGRFLMSLVLYEHFSTEHVRGHHKRVGTSGDPATARYGERFWPFFRRTVPGQFKSAWDLEVSRVGAKKNRWRLLRSRVLQGVVFEALLLAVIAFAAGLVPLAAFVGHALVAIILLEDVNYFEHWGLVRGGGTGTGKVTAVDSWDSEGWFTHYSLVGLARHADHHRAAARPFESLRHVSESPKLPSGYYYMVILVLFKPWKFRRIATEELQRRKLGPYVESAAVVEAA